MPFIPDLRHRSNLLVVELFVVVATALLPLFFDLSYQINLYMIWEGAYRLSLHELPYRDFGIPMGIYGWVIPAVFFKVFGASLFTLAKTQAFMNVISGVSFRWILVRVGVPRSARFLAILVFALTYILGLYWPQYNHTVIIFQLVAFGFLFQYFAFPDARWGVFHLIASAFFFSIAFFTKQDAGGLAIMIVLSLVSYHSYATRSLKPLAVVIVSLTIFFLLNILPFLQYDFGYWFNYGQPPHYARISLYDIIRINATESRWEKIYLALVIGIYLYHKKRSGTTHLEDLFTLFTLGILIQAMIFQVTSYVPKDNNIFYHSFFTAYALYFLFKTEQASTWQGFTILLLMICLWWSEKYWKYVDRVITKVIPTGAQPDVVSINTYILEPAACDFYANVSTWQLSDVESFKHVRMPAATVAGIDDIMALIGAIKNKKEPRVLNMSELTPLAKEAGFNLESGPLWFHYGVGLFDRELDTILSRINIQDYDVVIFENIPTLNNFYPFAIREALIKKYPLRFSFEAPRIVYPGVIEVYALY